MKYETTAVELIRALRGKRSRAELSRRVGYRSNIVHRWESHHSWPTAARFLQVHRQLRPAGPCWIERFFHDLPEWAKALDPHFDGSGSCVLAAPQRQDAYREDRRTCRAQPLQRVALVQRQRGAQVA